MARKKKSKRMQLVEQLDDLTTELVLKRDKKKCVLCGGEAYAAGHLITRKIYSVRWNIMNVWGTCKGCNLLHEYQPHIYTAWFLLKFGKNKFLELVDIATTPRKYKDSELEEMIKQIQESV